MPSTLSRRYSILKSNIQTESSELLFIKNSAKNLFLRMRNMKNGKWFWFTNMRRKNCICLWIYNDDDDDAFEMWQHKLRNIYIHSNKREWMNLIEMHIFAFFWYVSIVYITVLINMSHAIMNECKHFAAFFSSPWCLATANLLLFECTETYLYLSMYSIYYSGKVSFLSYFRNYYFFPVYLDINADKFAAFS